MMLLHLTDMLLFQLLIFLKYLQVRFTFFEIKINLWNMGAY